MLGRETKPSRSFADTPPQPRRSRRGNPYHPALVERARALIEETVLGRAAIAAEVGVSLNTIVNWQAREGWVRPPGKRRERGVVAPEEVLPRPHRVSKGGKGRFHRPEVVAAVRRLVEETVMTRGAIAARTGVSRETVRLWAVREGWSRPPGTTLQPAPDGPGPLSGPPRASGVVSRAAPDVGRRARYDKGRPYRRETVDRVRALVEGTGLTQAAIAAKVGIGPATVSAWMRDKGWRRPLDAARCTAFVAVDRAGFSARFAAAFARLAALAGTLPEREGTGLALEGLDAASLADLARVAEAARRFARHHDRAGLMRLPVYVRTGEPWEPVRLSAVPIGPRGRRPRGEGDLAAARAAWEGTRVRRDVIARGLGIRPTTLTEWAQHGGWVRPFDAPSPFGGSARNPGWTERFEGRRAARLRLVEAERRLDALEAGGAGIAPSDVGRIEAVVGELRGALAALRRMPSSSHPRLR